MYFSLKKQVVDFLQNACHQNPQASQAQAGVLACVGPFGWQRATGAWIFNSQTPQPLNHPNAQYFKMCMLQERYTVVILNLFIWLLRWTFPNF